MMILTKGEHVKNQTSFLWLMILAISLTSVVTMAQEQRRHQRGPRFEAVKECADQLGITLPERGSTIQQNSETDENREKIRACLEAKRESHRAERETVRAQVDACLTAKGITPPQPGGQGPSAVDESTRAAVKECFESVRGAAGSAAGSSSGGSLGTSSDQVVRAQAGVR